MAIDRDYAGQVFAKSLVASTALSVASLGLQFFMLVYGLIIFRESAPAARSGRLPYLFITFLLFALSTISYGIDVDYMYRVLWDARGGDQYLDLLPLSDARFTTLSRCSIVGMTFVSDGLLMYRCYVLCKDRLWVMILPLLCYLTTVGVGLVALMQYNIPSIPVAVVYPSVYAFFSVAVNLMVTGIIAVSLIQARQRLASNLSDRKTSHILGAAAVLIESATPVSIFGLVYAIVQALAYSSTGDLLVLNSMTYIIGSLWWIFAALSPQMITFRVTTGRSWTNQHPEASYLVTRPLGNEKLEFKHTTAGSISEDQSV